MRGERGVATVQAIVLAAAVVVLAAVLLQAALLVALRHRVEAAADLAALAGAGAAQDGRDGCAAARLAAGRNGAEVVACRMDLAVATVDARSSVRTLWGGRWSAQVRARAAPVDYVPPRPGGAARRP